MPKRARSAAMGSGAAASGGAAAAAAAGPAAEPPLSLKEIHAAALADSSALTSGGCAHCGKPNTLSKDGAGRLRFCQRCSERGRHEPQSQPLNSHEDASLHSGYCSRECQKAMWRWHKHSCSQPALDLSGHLRIVCANSSPGLRTLNLSRLDLADADMDQLSTALLHNTTLRGLNLQRQRRLTGAGFSKLIPALSGPRRIFSLKLPRRFKRNPEVSQLLQALHNLCAERLLAALRADDRDLTHVQTKDSYCMGFGDEEAEILAEALTRNTHVQSVHMTAGAGRICTISKSGQQAIAAAVSSDGCGVTTVRLDSTSIDPALATAIGRACWVNALRRLRANDPALKRANFNGNPFFDESPRDRLTELKNALRGNTHLRAIEFPQIPVGNDELQQLQAAVEYTAVEAVGTVGVTTPSMQIVADETMSQLDAALRDGVAAGLHRALVANRSARVRGILSLQVHRPFQRLVLAAIYYSSSVALSLDVLEIIVGHLRSSLTNPHRHVGNHVLASHDEAFAWHRVEKSVVDRVAKRRRR
jgi:hypothetical protein